MAAARTQKHPLTRDRSMPYKGPFLAAVAARALQYLAIVAIGTLAVLFVFERNRITSYGLALAVGAFGFLWLVAFLKCRSVRCPLCKGTPFLDTAALKHSKARRIPPFDHGTTAVLATLFTLRCRCMYCGTRYDFLKPSSKIR